MKKKRFPVEQIAGVLKQQEAGMPVKKLLAEAGKDDTSEFAVFLEMRQNRLRSGDFVGYLNTFASHKKLQPFLKTKSRLSPKEYSEILRDVWIGEEVIMRKQKTWLKLFNSKSLRPEYLMTAQERKTLAELPAEIEIWRGCGHKAGARGSSWTLDKSCAERFATYSCGSRRQTLTKSAGKAPWVAFGTCRKSKVLAFFAERDESEIVINPANVKLLRVSSLPPCRTWRFP